MSRRRMERVNDLIREVVSEIIRDLKDPALDGVLISVTDVRVTSDFSYAVVKVSVMAGTDQQHGVIVALDRASGYMRRQLNDRVRIRKTPQLRFELDDSLEQGARVLQLIRETITPETAPE